MLKQLMQATAIMVLLGGLTACGSTEVHHHHYDQPECVECAAHVESSGWCESCNVGYVDGQRVDCRGCYTVATTGLVACPVHGTND